MTDSTRPRGGAAREGARTGQANATPGRDSSAEPETPLPPPEYPDDVRYLETTSQIEAMAAKLRGTRRLAVDMESDSFYHYFDKVCLMQLTADGVDYIIDPLGGADLSSLQPVFADPAVEKIFHGADNDIALIGRTCGLETSGIFDTMIAAQIAGLRRFGLGDLVAHFFGWKLDKRFQRYDWSSRPLAPEHLHYARSDTHFLSELRDRLWERIEELGRTAQALEEFEVVAAKKLQAREFVPDECLKVAGAQDLDDRGLRVLRELFVVRDEIARNEDLATFRIMGNEVLMSLVHHRPTQVRELFAMRGMHPRVPKNYGTQLVAAIKRGLSSQEPPPRPPARQPRPANFQEIEARFNRLKKWRVAKAAELELDPAIVASNAILYSVARHAPEASEQLREVPLVRRWQVEAYGNEWLKMLKER